MGITNRNDEEMEMTISIKDMLMRICLKWRVLFIWAVVFAVVFNALGILKDYKNFENQKQEAIEKTNKEIQLANAEKEVSQTEIGLSEREVADVRRVVDTYADMQERYETAREYIENSVRMQLDPSSVPTLEIHYNIDTKYQVEYPYIDKMDYTDSIINAYCDAVETNEALDSIHNAMSTEIGREYVKELISTKNDSNMLDINIIAPTEDDCVAIGEVIKDVVKKTTSKLKNQYGDFEITLTMDTYGNVANSQLLNEQTTVVSNLNNIRNTIVNMTTGMREEQKSYLNALLDLEAVQNGVVTDTAIDNLDEETRIEMTINFIQAKMIIIGGGVGIFLVVCWMGCLYIFSARIRVVDDIEDVYGINNLGMLTIKKKKNKIDKKITEIFTGKDDFTYEEQIRMVCAGIRISSQKMGLKKIYITGSSKENLENCCMEIAKRLEECSLEVEYGMSVLYDPESLEKMFKSDGVVLIEKVDSSRYKDVKKEKDICVNNKIPIIGAVVLN